MINCLQPGRELINANPGCLIRAFSKLDFPTLLRPRKAISTGPRLASPETPSLPGNCRGSAALIMNSAVSVATTAVSASGERDTCDEAEASVRQVIFVGPCHQLRRSRGRSER